MEEFNETFLAIAEFELGAKAVRDEDRRTVTFGRRCRYFCDGGILGSREFIRESMAKFYDAEAIARRKLKSLKTSSGRMYSLRRLMG